RPHAQAVRAQRRHLDRLRRERGGPDRRRPQPAWHPNLRASRARAAREELHEDRLARPGGPLMTHKMRIRKGDTVHRLSGKDRGKEGRVIEARPREQRVVVENLNIQKRYTRPRALLDANRMGGTQMTPGGVIQKAAPVPVAKVMLVCPTCNRPTRIGMTTKEVKGREVHVRVCKRADCGQEIDK